MSASLPFTLRLEDLLSPGIAQAIRQVQGLNQQVDKPHKLKVDASQARGALSGIGSLLGKLGIAFGAMQAFSFLKESVSMFNAAEQSGAQFEATLKSTGGAVGITKKELLGLSNELMGKSLFDDDAITQAQSVLLTFTNIKGSVYKDALPAITDLATKMGGDLQGATVQVGKALNDPVAGITALSRVGVSFSVSQKATIKSLVETGQTAKAQSLILAELGKEFGGSAEAAAASGTGGWTVLKNKFDNIRESIGGMLAAGVGKTLPFFDGLVTQGQKVMDWLGEHVEGIKAVFAPLREAVQPLIDVVTDLWQQLYGGAETGNLLKTVFNVLGGVIRFISPAIKVMATLLGEVLKFQMRVYKAVFDFIATSPRLQKFFVGLWEGAVAVFKGIAEAAGKFLGGVGDIVEGIFTMDWDKLKSGFAKALGGVLDQNPISLGLKAAKGFSEGYEKGIEKKDFFVEGPAPAAAGTDAATAFMGGGAKAGNKPAAMTAGASQPSGGVSGSGGKGVTNIYFTVKEMLGHMKVEMMSAGESAQEIAQLVRDTVIAELNDVNTLAST